MLVIPFPHIILTNDRATLAAIRRCYIIMAILENILEKFQAGQPATLLKINSIIMDILLGIFWKFSEPQFHKQFRMSGSEVTTVLFYKKNLV